MRSKSNERAKRAVEAMKPLGFSRKLTVDVLKRLVSLYSSNWELIEDDNYRVLADAILDAQENANEETSRCEEAGTVSEPPHDQRPVRTRPGAQEDQGQSPPVNNNGACDPGPSSSKRRQEDDMDGEPETEADLLVRKRLRRKPTMETVTGMEERTMIPPPPQPPSPAELTHRSTQGSTSGASIDRLSGAIITYQRVSLSRRKSNAIPLKEPKLEPGTEAEINNGDAPLTVIFPHSDSASAKNTGSRGNRESVPDQTSMKIDVGSSSNGQIKLAFQFLTRPDMPAPSLDDFFKMVENQYLKSFGILNPSFSLPNLMNEMCQVMAEKVSYQP